MKTNLCPLPALLVIAITAGGMHASADDAPPAQTIVQVKFDRLIPTSSPTFQPDFNRLSQPRFDRLIPTSFPAASQSVPTPGSTVSFGLIPWSFPTERVNFNRLNQVTLSAPTPTLLRR